MKEKEPELFETGEEWEEAWRGMPEFVQQDLTPFHTVMVHFEARADMEAFARLIDQRVELTTASVWYPEAEIGRFADRRYIDPKMPPKPRENEFVEEAEACAITAKEWANLLNTGLQRGLEIEQVNALILERFGVSPRNLKTEQYESALSCLRDQ